MSTSAAEFVIMFLVELLKFYVVQPSMARTDDRRSYLAEETRLWSIARTSKGSKQSTKKYPGARRIRAILRKSARLANKRSVLMYVRSNQRIGTDSARLDARASVLGSSANCA